jgi:uncharacterized protein Usg
MASASVLTFLLTSKCLTTNSLLQLFTLEVKVMLQLDSQPVCLGIKPPSGAQTRFLLLSDSCGFVDVWRPLWRGQVCCLQLLLALISTVILGSKSCSTHDHILLSWIWYSPNVAPTLNHLAYDISVWTAQKTLFLCCCFQLLLCRHAYFQSCYSVTAVVCLLILWSLPSNGSACHNMNLLCRWSLVECKIAWQWYEHFLQLLVWLQYQINQWS